MKTILAFLISMSVTACAKKNISNSSIPSAIQKRIDEIKSQPVQNPPVTVYSYDYNGETVFYFSAPCCDRYSDLLNAKGKLICHPDGGFTGKGDGSCKDFGEKRSNEKLIWKDTRGTD